MSLESFSSDLMPRGLLRDFSPEIADPKGACSLLQGDFLVGKTPLVRLSRFKGNPDVELFGKSEGNNPSSSVKDRAARAMIEGAERRGELKPGVRIIEPTSGNTGIALAMAAARKGFEIELVMPEGATLERVQTMRAFGAKVTLTPAALSMEGAIDYARAEVAKGGAITLDQFSNADNWRSHYEGTGPEIWEATRGRITHFVSAMGTTGTIMGVSRYLKEKNPEIRIIGVQPGEGSRIDGIRRWPLQYLPAIYEPSRVDRVVDVSQRTAEEAVRILAREEGLFVGASSGAAACGALRIAQEIEKGVVVFVMCDRGDRYLSSGLFHRKGVPGSLVELRKLLR